jgi:hypothetical protein
MNVVKVSPIAVLGPAAIFPAGCWVEDWRLQPGNLPSHRNATLQALRRVHFQIARNKIYGADDIELSERARENLARFKRRSFAELPVCIAKTQYSLSDDPKRLGAPSLSNAARRRPPP